MSLNELLRAVDSLTTEELNTLRAYINQRHGQQLTPEARIQMIDEAAAAIREGMSQEQLDEMFAVMNT